MADELKQQLEELYKRREAYENDIHLLDDIMSTAMSMEHSVFDEVYSVAADAQSKVSQDIEELDKEIEELEKQLQESEELENV